MQIKIEDKIIILRKGDTIHGFSSDVSGEWKIKSLKPFCVIASQNGKRWKIDVSSAEFARRKFIEALK